MAVRDARDRIEVKDVGSRVPDRLGIHGLRARGDRLFDCVGIVDVDESDVDTHPAQRYIELCVGAAVQRTRRNDLVPFLGQGEDADQLRRLA